MLHESRPTARPLPSRATVAFAVTAVALTVLVGAFLRLADPLSSPVVAAEDPYTHMALVREHLRTGDISPLDSSATVYPPGLHAFLASAWVYTGSDLYDIVRIGPVIFGAIGILGMALLLWRTSGPVAGFVAALAMAVAPEAIFRTTMMSPTAMDLAILPFMLYAMLRVLAGRLGWVGVAAPMALFLALAHPWLLAILCAAGVMFLLFTVLFPTAVAGADRPSPLGIASIMAVLGTGFAVALTMPTFGDVLNIQRGTSLIPIGLGVAALALAPIVCMLRWPRLRQTPAWLARGPAPLSVRFGSSLAIAATLLAVCFLAVQRGLPAYVDLPRMFGWPALALAFAALVALPFIASPIANLAAGLFAATLPFVVFNPLHSEFLPHRTSIFLGIAMAILAGVAAAALVRVASHALRVRHATRTPSRRTTGRLMLVAPALLIATLLGGAVYAGTPDAYPGGWYRLYNSCELDAFREIARQADAQPNAIIVVGDWEAKLVLAALTTDAQRVWFDGGVFTSEQRRGDLEATMHHQGRPVIVVMDRFLRTETPDADTNFVSSAPWQPMGAWCANMGIEQPHITAYVDSGSR